MVPAGEIFKLKDQVHYSDEGTQSVTFAKTDSYIVMLFAMKASQKLPAHSAPGQALVFALEGKGLVNYDGKESILSKGENVCFEKGITHWIEALEDLKIAVCIAIQ